MVRFGIKLEFIVIVVYCVIVIYFLIIEMFKFGMEVVDSVEDCRVFL